MPRMGGSVAAVTAGLVLGLCACRSEAQTPASQPTSQPAVAGRVYVVPWLEVSPDRKLMDRAVEGLRLWRQVTDTAIISVDPAQTRLIKHLRENVPEMRIIPGLKTSPVLIPMGFDSVAGWRRIGNAARELRDYTGISVLVLEHESAIKQYIDGKYRMNWDRLREGLKELPADATILWYPSAAMSGEVLQRYLDLCRAAESLPNVMFIDHASLYSPGAYGQPGTLNAVRKLKEAASKPPIPLIYCCGEKWWPFERVPEAMRLAGAEGVILYPGDKRWIEAARYLGTRLPSFSPPTTSPSSAGPPLRNPGVQDKP